MIVESSILPINCNVKNETAINEAVKISIQKFGGIDIAIHNACKCTFLSMEKTDYSIYEEVFDVNYLGALRLTKVVIPYMKQEGKGKIIFTSSGVGIYGRPC